MRLSCWSVCVAAFLVLALPAAQAVYFMVTEGTERCFIEEVPEETLVLGSYKSPDHVGDVFNPSAGSPGLQISVKNPSGEKILTQYTEAEGRFAFTSHVGGEHLVCISTNTTHWFGTSRKFRFHLRIDVGESATDYEEIAKLEHLSAIEVEIRKLNDKVRTIRAEQAYQRSREESFRNTSESTNARVMWWSVAQTLVLLVSGFWQIYHLKNFFQQKKLV